MIRNISSFGLFVLMLLVCTFFPVSAQEIDVENMSNEELMLLLQSIVLKLDNNESTKVPQENAAEIEVQQSDEAAVPTAEPKTSDSVDVPEATEKPGAAEEKKTFEIYENKKLIIGRMPDSYFIRKNNGDEMDKDNNSENNNNDGGHDGFDGGHGWVWDDDGRPNGTPNTGGRDPYGRTDEFNPGWW